MAGKIDPATGLQEQQKRFADEYLVDFNATEAYKRAGYKAKGEAAHAAASRLLANPKVQEYLRGRRNALNERIESDQVAALQNIIDMAHGDIRCLVDAGGRLKPLQDLTREQAILIQGFEAEEMWEWQGTGEDRLRVHVGTRFKYKLVNFVEVRKLLGVHHGLFAKKMEHSGPNGGPIQTQSTVIGELLDLVEGSETGIGRSVLKS